MNKIVKLMAGAAFALAVLVPGSVKGTWDAEVEMTNLSSHRVTIRKNDLFHQEVLVSNKEPYISPGILSVDAWSKDVVSAIFPLYVDNKKICTLECLYFANPGNMTDDGRVVVHIKGLDGKLLVDKWVDRSGQSAKASVVFDNVRVEAEAIKEGYFSTCKFRVFDYGAPSSTLCQQLLIC